MIRGLFLQPLYQLSNPQLEDQLIDRLSFRRFAGLSLDQPVPYFGYKGHIGADVGSNLIRSLLFTEAPHDSTQLEALLSGDERATFGDKIYPSKDLKIRCRSEGATLVSWTKPTGTPR